MSFLSFFVSPIGRYIAGGLVILAVIGGIYWKGHSDGAAKVQAKWNAAIQQAIERAEKARSDAERSTPSDGVPNDKFNRD